MVVQDFLQAMAGALRPGLAPLLVPLGLLALADQELSLQVTSKRIHLLRTKLAKLHRMPSLVRYSDHFACVFLLIRRFDT